MLSPEEHTIILRYCMSHVVAKCPVCSASYRLPELAADFFNQRENLCPPCGRDLTVAVRAHLYDCAMLPERVRRRAQQAREAARLLVKQSHELTDKENILILEAEVALAALRVTLSRTASA